MEEPLKDALLTLSDVIGIMAVAILVWGVFIGLVGFTRVEVSHLRFRRKRTRLCGLCGMRWAPI
jgi:hypothetical protein